MVIIILLIILLCILTGLIIYLVVRKDDKNNTKDLQLQSQILAQQAEIDRIKNEKPIIQKVPVYTGWGGWGWGGRGWGWRRGPWRWRR